jgi:hypothetical protein
MNPAPAHQNQVKPSRSKHNSNHRKQRRKAAKSPKEGGADTARLAQRNSPLSDSASHGGNPKRSPDRTVRPVAIAAGGMEGVAKKKTSRGRPNRPWKPWTKLSLTDIENIAERRGNSGRGFEQ